MKSKIKYFCNDCKNINLTEEQQSKMKFKPDHKCMLYRSIVRHECTGPQHYKIFPCLECMEDGQRNYSSV